MGRSSWELPIVVAGGSKLAEKIPRTVKFLNSIVRFIPGIRVCDINIVRSVCGNASWALKLPVAVTISAPLGEKMTLGVELL